VWCDTEYAFQGGDKVALEEVIARVEEIGTPLVEVTGGEPLVQASVFPLVSELLERGFTVLVETSGAVDISPLDPRAHKIMDLKCPGSGEMDKNLWSNLEHLTGLDEVKFVVKDRADYEWTRETIRDHALDERVKNGSLRALLVSPVWNQIDLEELSGWILEDGLPLRLQLQLHKLIWGPDATGV
jgi:7-carboxy-7-deazaguanine synthase